MNSLSPLIAQLRIALGWDDANGVAQDGVSKNIAHDVSKRFSNAPPTGQLLARPALLEKLDATSQHRLVCLRAPAGYGKTSLMSGYAAQLRRHGVVTRWAAVEEIAAQGLGLRKTLADLTDSAIRACEKADSEGRDHTVACTVMLDNIDTLLSDELDAFCDFLHASRNLPVRFIFAARSRDVLQRLSQRGSSALEVSGAAFAFDACETRALTHSLLGECRHELAVVLYEHTQGWPAAIENLCTDIRNTGLIRPHSPDRDASTSALSKYLETQILDQLPVRMRDTLLEIALVNPISAPLLESLFAHCDGSRLLQEAIDCGLPVSPAGAGWHWIHPLLSQHLREMALEGDVRASAEVALRAGEWLAGQGRLASAVDTLLAAGHFEKAVTLIEPYADVLLKLGDYATLVCWCERLPAELMQGRKAISAAYALALALCGGRYELAAKWRTLVQQESDGQEASERSHRTANLIQMYHVVAHGQIDQIHLSMSALRAAVLSPSEDAWRGGGLHFAVLLAQVSIATGDYEQAACNIQIAKRIAREERDALGLARTHYLEAVLQSTIGELHSAMDHLKTAVLLVHGQQPEAESCQRALHSMICGLMAALHYERNQIDEALRWSLAERGDADLSLICVDAFVDTSLVGFRAQLVRNGVAHATTFLQQRLDKAQATGIARVISALELEFLRHEWENDPARVGREEDLCPQFLDDPHRPELCIPPGEELHGGGIAHARLMLHTGKTRQGLQLLKALLVKAQSHQRRWREVRLHNLLIVAHSQLGEQAHAMRHCRSALELGVQMGLVRSFLDEGPLLLECVSKHLEQAISWQMPANLVAYAQELLMFAESDSRRAAGSARIALSDREGRLLHLLADGRTNKEVASELSLSLNTVKWYVGRIYAKLGTNRRDQAILLARERGMIA